MMSSVQSDIRFNKSHFYAKQKATTCTDFAGELASK